MPEFCQRFIHRSPNSIDAADGSVFWQGVPGRVGEILAELHLRNGVKALGQNLERGDFAVGRQFLIPRRSSDLRLASSLDRFATVPESRTRLAAAPNAAPSLHADSALQCDRQLRLR